MSNLWSRGLGLVGIIYLYSSVAVGGTITVAWDGSGDHLTIQAGIDAAVNGDVVEVADGEYSGEGNRDINFHGKAITVTGNTEDPNLVVIDCMKDAHEAHRGFLFASGEGNDSILEGFKITRGYAPEEELYWEDEFFLYRKPGGGVFCNGGNPLIRSCVVSDTIRGGGIYCFDSDNVKIADSKFGEKDTLVVNHSSVEVDGCEFIAAPNTEGGAILNQYYSRLIVRNCLIRDFMKINNFSAAGITNINNSEARVENTVFINNWGGAIVNGNDGHEEHDVAANENVKCTVVNCVFDGNKGSGKSPAGGIYNGSRSNVEISDCLFSGNSSGGDYGAGGIANDRDSTVTVADCEFVGNSGGDAGAGGIYSDNVNSLTVTGCKFSENYLVGMKNFNEGDITITDSTFIGNGPPAMLNDKCSPTIEGCTFSTRGTNGGICSALKNINGSNAKINNCIFSGTIGEFGYGMANEDSSPQISNCLFVGNKGSLFGAGIRNLRSNPTITNCVFSGNGGLIDGGGIRGGGLSNTEIENCILWGNSPNQISDGSNIVASYCDVQGGWAGVGNIDVDPLFVEAGYWDDNGTPEDLSDDVFVMGDYHLMSQGGRWGDAAGSWVVDGDSSPCIDAGDMMAGIGVEPFPNGGILNMGAYGGTGQASKSYFGGEPCGSIIAGDINGDCVVNLVDFSIMAIHWLESSAVE